MGELTHEQIIESIEKMSVLELNKLVKALEEKFDVSAAAPVAFAGMQPAAAAEEEKEEQTEFSVVLTSFGDKKIPVLKTVRALTGLGLKEAKELVESLPKPVKEGVPKEEADKVKAELEEAGGQAEIK